MLVSGTVKSYNPHKGWGFVDFNGTDIFVMKKELHGIVVDKGQTINFDIVKNEKGLQATNIQVAPSGEDVFYFGEIKSYSPKSGWGFITTEALPGQDVFVMKPDLPGGVGPQGAYCKFKVVAGEKGPSAKNISFLGAACNHIKELQMMEMMSYFAGSWGKGGGKGWKGGAKGLAAMQALVAKGADKGAGKGKSKGPRLNDFPAETKVWVGNLPEDATVESLTELFGRTGGTVKLAAIMRGNTGGVAYETPEEAARAIAMLNVSDMGGQAIQADVWSSK